MGAVLGESIKPQRHRGFRGKVSKTLPAGSDDWWIRALQPCPAPQLPAGRAEEPSQNSQPPLMPVKLKDLQSLLAKPFRSRDE